MKFKNVFSFIPPRPPVHGEAEKRALRRKAASLAATGNVLIQSGLFATKEDLAERRAILLYNEK